VRYTITISLKECRLEARFAGLFCARKKFFCEFSFFRLTTPVSRTKLSPSRHKRH
jgi:hypothetical protein